MKCKIEKLSEKIILVNRKYRKFSKKVILSEKKE